tara:strand:- start:370 stop:1023 length:654 start_codon:yes stop_codon:yes gene_type:complete
MDTNFPINVNEFVSAEMFKLLDKIAIQISNDNDISLLNIKNSIDKIVPRNIIKPCFCKAINKSTNRPCNVELKPGQGEYCGRHKSYNNSPIIEKSSLLQCIAVTNKMIRCTHTAVSSKGLCTKHMWTEQQTSNPFKFDPNKRKCLYSSTDDEGELIRCSNILNDKFYTCCLHRDLESTLRDEYDLTTDAIEFQREYIHNRISHVKASLIYGPSCPSV